MNTISQLNYLLDKKTKLRLVGLFFMLLLGSFVELLGISIILPIVDIAMNTNTISENTYCRLIMKFTFAESKEEVLLVLIGITICIYVLKNVYLSFLNRVQVVFSSSIQMNLASKLMSAYLKQPYSYFLSVNSSDLMRSVSTDVGQLYQLVNNILCVVSNGITAICIVIFLAISNFQMTILVSFVLGMCLLLIVFVLQKRIRANGRMSQQVNGYLIKHLRQAFEGIKEIKLMNTENHFINAYKSTYKQGNDISIRNALIAVLPKYLIETFAIISILGYLAVNILYNNDYVSILPQLAIFCAAAYKLLPSVNALYSGFNMIIYYKASIDLVYNDIRETDSFEKTFDTIDTTVERMPFHDIIKVNNISFKYPGIEKKVLKDVNIDIPKGKSVALIGASGGGKTTTADIILGLLEPTEGSITVDGVDIRENVWGWKKNLGYIPQAIYLTDDSIRANVAFGVDEKDIDDEKIWRALADAQLKDFVESLPEGIYTKVGERGIRVSGGQRQRIGIARTLYCDPEIIVLDEATSALDNETEKEIMKAIERLHGSKTILIIAHRLSTINNCDLVYRVEKGMAIRER